MQSINYKITLGSMSYTLTDLPFLVDIRAQAALAVPLNRCRIRFGSAGELAKSIATKPAEPVKVELGYGSHLDTVFSGVVQSVEAGLTTLTIQAISACYPLTTARFNMLYEKQTAGDIVTDLVKKRLKLKVKTIESGVKFPVYALGDRTSAYGHICTLANQCGFDIYTNTNDQLVFAPYKAAKTHSVTYGKNLLRFSQTQPLPGIAGVEIYGESPASQGQGNKAYAWLTKKEVKGSAGKSSSTTVRLADPTARTQAIARKVAQATLTRQTHKTCGQLRVLGESGLRLGDGIQVAGMNASAQNGTFKITGVTHQLNRRRGFYTDIIWEEV